jgi:hypothetical protein
MREVHTRSLPEGLSPVSEQVVGILAKYTVFAWPVLTAQCRSGQVDPLHLDQETLGKVIGRLAQGVAAFTTPAKAKRFEEELLSLLRHSGAREGHA